MIGFCGKHNKRQYTQSTLLSLLYLENLNTWLMDCGNNYLLYADRIAPISGTRFTVMLVKINAFTARGLFPPVFLPPCA